MNEHLIPIFETLLPALGKSGIDYWVFGGVAIAGIKGKFIRENDDVDIFVFNEQYSVANDIVTPLAADLGWQPIGGQEVRGRPKREFIPIGKSKSIFSIMPVYNVGLNVKFVFPVSTDKYFSKDELTREERNAGAYRFFTPSRAVIRDLFIHNLLYLIKHKKILTDESRIDLRNKYQRDASVIL